MQAQFAGYYVAKEKGYYRRRRPRRDDQARRPGHQPRAGRPREAGGVRDRLAAEPPGAAGHRQQPRQHRPGLRPSGTTEVTWRDAGITTFRKMRGKRFGVWIFGNEFEQRAALVKNGMNPDKDVRLVKQNFDMNAFLSRQIDAASAMTYNELAQVLETKNPRTGKLYTLATSGSSSTPTSAPGCCRTASSCAATGSGARPTRRPRSSSCRPPSGVGLLPRPLPRVRQHRAQERSGASARPPALADERGQRADLAEQARRRCDGSGRVQPHGEHRAAFKVIKKPASGPRTGPTSRSGPSPT